MKGRLLAPLRDGTNAVSITVAVTIIGLIALPWIISKATDSTVSSGASLFWQFQLIHVFILSIYAISYNLLLGHTGLFSLGHALFYGGAAYTFGISVRTFGIHWAYSLAIAFGVVVLLSLVFGFFAVRTSGIYLGVTTFVFAEVFHVLISSPRLIRITGADDGLRKVPVPSFIDPVSARLTLYYLALISLLLALLFMWRLMRAPTGWAFEAIRENETRAAHLGYRTGRYKTMAFVIASVLAGFAGALSTVLFRGAAPSTLSVDQSALALLAVVVGGAGTLLGPVVGVIAVFLLREILRSQLGMAWPVVYGIVGIALIMVAREGVVGLVRKWFWPRRPAYVSGQDGAAVTIDEAVLGR